MRNTVGFGAKVEGKVVQLMVDEAGSKKREK
jgi:hypothetical protein